MTTTSDNCGYIEVSSKWVDEAEHFKANNLTRVDGEIVPAGLAEARRSYSRARSTYETASRKLTETRDIASGKAGSAGSSLTCAVRSGIAQQQPRLRISPLASTSSSRVACSPSVTGTLPCGRRCPPSWFGGSTRAWPWLACAGNLSSSVACWHARAMHARSLSSPG